MFTLAIRVPFVGWAPVFELFWWQALLSEKLISGWSRWTMGFLWLCLYTLAAVVSCMLLERSRIWSGRVWVRAVGSSILFEASILLVAFKVAPE